MYDLVDPELLKMLFL